jgi:hypothetical protein
MLCVLDFHKYLPSREIFQTEVVDINEIGCTHMQGRLLFIVLILGCLTKQTTRPTAIEPNAPLSKQHKLCLITSENKIHNKLRANKQFLCTILFSGSSATQQTNRINNS